jgi:tryptophan 2,3-dioxygenase
LIEQKKGERRHFASAMKRLGKKDGDGGDTGVSYLDLADFCCPQWCTSQ